MAVTVKIIKIDCPFKKCDKNLQAEVRANWDTMTEEQKEELKAQVRNRLLPGIKKHHKDGHPRS